MWRQRPTSRWCSHKARNVENYHTLPASKREAQNRLWVTGLRENHACRCLHPVLPASRPVLCLYHHFKQHTASSIEEALNKCLENDWVQNTWPYNSFCTRVLSQAFTRQRELRTLITHSTPSGEFLLQLLLTVSKSGLFDFLATNHLFSFQLLIFRWAVPSLALAYPFPPHWPFSALNFQAQPQVPCIPVSALMGHFSACLPELNRHHLTVKQHPQLSPVPLLQPSGKFSRNRWKFRACILWRESSLVLAPLVLLPLIGNVGGDYFHTLKNKILYVINTIRSTDLYRNMAAKANVLLGPEHETPFTKQVPTDKGKMFKFVLSI